MAQRRTNGSATTPITAQPRRITAHEVQAKSEGVEIVGDGEHVEFMGSKFRMAEKIGLMPLMHLAMAGKSDVDTADMEGLAAMYEVVRDCIDQTRPQEPDPDNPGETRDAGESEWDRFERLAVSSKAEAEEIQKVVTDVIVALSARPTKRPGDSSAGQRAISAKSKASSQRTDMRSDDGMVPVGTVLGL